MPCYEPPLTNKEIREMHESYAIRILSSVGRSCKNGPDAVKLLCDICRHSNSAEIKAIGAEWWWKDHQRHDLRQSGLAKLTEAEQKALGVGDNDEGKL